MVKNPSECFKDVIQEHFYLKIDELKSQLKQWRENLWVLFVQGNINADYFEIIKVLLF
jgi:hypothetical protein